MLATCYKYHKKVSRVIHQSRPINHLCCSKSASIYNPSSSTAFHETKNLSTSCLIFKPQICSQSTCNSSKPRIILSISRSAFPKHLSSSANHRITRHRRPSSPFTHTKTQNAKISTSLTGGKNEDLSTFPKNSTSSNSHSNHKEETLQNQKEETSPNQKEETLPHQKEEPSPNQKEETLPHQKEEPSPNQKEKTLPHQKEETSPNQKEETLPHQKEEPSPNQKEETLPHQKEEPSPNQKEKTLPHQKEETSPNQKEETLPHQKEETLPNHEEEPLPHQKEETLLTFDLQPTLPSLPVPRLRDTHARYLRSLQPFLTPEQYAASKRIADAYFTGPEAKQTQAALVARAAGRRNWQTEWWLEQAFLAGRQPLHPLMNMSFAGWSKTSHLPVDGTKKDRPLLTDIKNQEEEALLSAVSSQINTSSTTTSKIQIDRAAQLIWLSATYWLRIHRQAVPVMRTRSGIPLCMAQFRTLFNTTRIPGRERDEIWCGFKTAQDEMKDRESKVDVDEGITDDIDASPCPKHIVIAYRGRYWKLDGLFTQKTKSGVKQATPKETEYELIDLAQIRSALTRLFTSEFQGQKSPPWKWKPCETTVDPDPDGPAFIGALTCLPREEWATARAHLRDLSPQNAQSLREIEGSMFVLSLTDQEPGSEDELNHLSLAGPAEYQWTDKSLTWVIHRNGEFTCSCEHSPNEGIVPGMLGQFVDERLPALIADGSGGGGSGTEEQLKDSSAESKKFEPSPIHTISITGQPDRNSQKTLTPNDHDTDLEKSTNLHLLRKNNKQTTIAEETTPDNTTSLPPTLTPLKFQTDSFTDYAIERARSRVRRTGRDIQVAIRRYTVFGAEFCTRHGYLPESVIQLAAQVAYFQLHGKPAPTYATASTKQFFQGRTETMKSCTVEAMAFARSVSSGEPEISKVTAFKRAIRTHDTMFKLALAGEGVDRHLLGLRLQAGELGLPEPAGILADPGFRASGGGGGGNYVLSSSFLGYGRVYGGTVPMVPEGYGMFYCAPPPRPAASASQENKGSRAFEARERAVIDSRNADGGFTFMLTKWKQNSETDLAAFWQALTGSFNEIKRLIEYAPK